MRRSRAVSFHRSGRDGRGARAQMPFSIIAVLLLVLSSTSIALVYSLDEGRSSSAIPFHTLERMKDRMSTEVQAVSRLAHTSALQAISRVTDMNETKVQLEFAETLNASIASTYPSFLNDLRTDVTHALHLTFLMASLRTAIAENDGSSAWRSESIPSYFVIDGNFSIDVSCPSGHIDRTVEMSQDVYVPLPLLLNRWGDFQRAATPRGELESMVRYELAALAQSRVMSGYGMGAKTGQLSTEAVITEQDVVRAINLAIVLEELRYFHGGDEEASSAFSGLGDANGVMDPADLFLRSYEQGGIDLAPIIAQTIYGRLDAIVLKWMEYYGFIDLVNLGDDILENSVNGVIDVIDSLTGGDLEGEAVTGYVIKALEEAGIPEYNYRWLCYGGPDALVDLPEFKICFIDDRGNNAYRTFQGRYAVDFPNIDLFSSSQWGDVGRQFRSETYAVAQTMSEYLRSIAGAVASRCSLPVLDLTLDPTDGKDFIQELDEQIRAAFDDQSSWLKPAIDAADKFSMVRDSLAQAILDFLDQRWTDLFTRDSSMYKAAWGLSGVLAGQLNGSSNFSARSVAEARQTIFAELLGGNWGAKECLQAAFDTKTAPALQSLQSALSQKYEQRNLLTDLLSYGVSNLPGIEVLLAKDALGSINGIRAGLQAQGGKADVPLSSEGMDLLLADGQQRHEQFEVDCVGVTNSDDDGTGTVDVKVTMPWVYPRTDTAYPNRHVTDLRNFTSTPYLTQWGIEYHGSFEMTVGIGGEGDGSLLPTTSIIDLDGTFNILTFSGWGLSGVEYAPTVTLVQDLKDLLMDIWDFLSSTVSAVGNLLGQGFGFFCQMLSDLLSYATAPIEALSNLLTEALQTMKEMSENLLSGVIKALADSMIAVLNGTTIRLSVLGVSVALVIGPSDTALVGTEDRVRADLSLSAFGAILTSSVRVLKLAGGQHTIVATATLSGEDWSADLTMDPLLQVLDHQVEVRGYLEGHILEIVAPVAERVQKASMALSDIPVLSQALKSIPSPVPGTKFNVDAGLEFSFNVLDRNSVLINEVELNPPGKDASREWVELYNPTSGPVDVTGWTLFATRGQPHQETLSGTVPAYGYLVHRFSGQALDNGEVKGFPLEESVTLLDNTGRRVDSAPWLKDLKDDDRTWQRVYDGSSKWEFRNSSDGKTNGLILVSEISTDWLVKLIEDCFLEAFDRFIDEGLDIWALDNIIQDALHNLKQKLLDMVEATVSSLRFFFQLGLADATGTAAGGFSVSLVYEGRAVRDCLEWLIDSVGEVLRDPLNPLAAGGRAPPTKTLADHVFLQLGIYASVGVPDLIAIKTMPRITATALIRVSLGSLGVFGATDEWKLDFGLVITGVQSTSLKGSPVSFKAACYDVWVLRGSLRPA